MNNIIEIMASREPVTVAPPRWQYDYGQVVQFTGIELPSEYEVQFSNGPRAEAVTVIGDADGAAVPDALMATGKPVYCWLVLHDGEDDGRVMAAAVIPVSRRGAVSDQEPTPEEQSAISTAIAALQAHDLEAEGWAKGQQNGVDVEDGSPYYHDNAKYWAGQAEDQAEAAEDSAEAAAGSEEGAEDAALVSEGYALGKQNGVNVGGTSPYYQNNAKYFRDRAQAMMNSANYYAGQAATSASTAGVAAANAQINASGAGTSAASAAASESNANSYKDLAMGYAAAASGYATQALGARDDVFGMTAQATGLPAGSDPTASYSEGVLSLGIPKGDTGDQGEIGPTPDLSIGTVTTGDAGTDAAATITGTAAEPVLNLTIPKGAKGDAGNGTMLAPAFAEATANAAGSYVTYDGGLYYLPSGHTANATWANTTKTAVTVGGDLSDLKSAFSSIEPLAENAYAEKTVSADVVTFDDGANNVPLKAFVANIDYVQSGSGDPSPTNIRPITGYTGITVYQSNEDTTNPTTKSISWSSEAGTVYKGYIDLLTGTLTVTGKAIQLTGTETVNKSTSYNFYWIGSTQNPQLADLDVGYNDHWKVPVVSHYKGVNYVSSSTLPDKTSDTFMGADGKTIGFKDDSYTTKDAFVAFLAGQYANGTPVTFYLPLATPQTYQLSEEQINSLRGVNNIWTSTGSIKELTYRADPTSLKTIIEYGGGLFYPLLKNGYINDANGSEATTTQTANREIFTEISETAKFRYLYIPDGMNVVFYYFGNTNALISKNTVLSDGSLIEVEQDYPKFRIAIYKTWGTNLTTSEQNLIKNKTAFIKTPTTGTEFLPISDVYVTNVQQRIYFNEICHVDRDGVFLVTVTGKTYPEVTYCDRYIQFNCTTASDFTVSIVYNDLNMRALASHTFTVHCVINTLPSKKYIFLGDSYTENGNMQKWFYDNNSSNVTLYGTKGTAPYLNEGRSGWSVVDYFSASKGGETNPFYNSSTQTFDFSYYMANAGSSFTDVDVVNVLLGRNDGFTSSLYPQIKKIADSIHAYNSNIIVTIMVANNVAVDNSGAGKYLQNSHRMNYKSFIYNRGIESYFEDDTNTVVVYQNLNLDNVYDFATTEVDASSLNEKQVTVYVDNVHPDTPGYKSMGVAYNSRMHGLFNT